ncbi:TonB-dependent receptor plug domain-containing protein [Pseudoalteromonas shioyasakiensis]|uniref:TonB-dependent receptor plug domain-containing protein n=1 Tax=Pseudoalteromonas shioyasakiensis TaxID=1190813 RepID=UPI001C3D4BE5|nr:TonB-dependent receptor [Pseudoalteromonas shioyasakiensis]
MVRAVQLTLPALFVTCSVLAEDTNNIEQITVEVSATANKEPVGTFDAPVSNLEYDPRVDLQSRNMAEAQADVTIRGGIFENTGFRVGSSTLFDPQSGHYFAEIPIAPQMLTGPSVLTGADNAVYGMNSSVGTVSFGWRPITSTGSVSLGTGTNGFNLQSIHAAHSQKLDSKPDLRLGFEGEYSHSKSDGSIDNGDHDFERASARIQLASSTSQTDLMFGSQEKFFGWPNLYTPFNFNETEDLETKLFMLNHKQVYGESNTFEVTGYYRKHNDHYVLSRENPAIFEAFHETTVKSLALSGHHRLNDHYAINYAGQFIADEIESTSLENNFTSRNYTKLSILPEYKAALTANKELTLRVGATFDDTNRDSSDTSFIADASLKVAHQNGSEHTWYASYAEATQVPGYTAIGGSETGGLFRSNYSLERETTDNLELGLLIEQSSWRLDSAIFYRKDKNLTDWTYRFDATSARFANPVDIDTLGVEFLANKSFESAELIASYTYLEKSEDYGTEDIDASFYALNYPDHRVTLGAVWQPMDVLELRIDNEWRKQHSNRLRSSDDEAFFTQLTLKFTPAQLDNVFVTFAADNIWDESFEEVPGTPGRGEQYTLSATYTW